MFDADFDCALQDGHGVFGHQLLEGDQEGRLQGDRSLDGGPAVRQLAFPANIAHGYGLRTCENHLARWQTTRHR